jgi:hypothetical protein
VSRWERDRRFRVASEVTGIRDAEIATTRGLQAAMTVM